ncbi:MAG: 8-amino-7-oxononanoate synthase [Planctomycetes bacterium SM23_32]|nr:MAG: 8-amino-7-oxononanoate synthase [Planctomycetes bacterium SM23_32]
MPLLKKVRQFKDPERVKAAGLYPYFRPISSAQDTEVLMDGMKVIMMGSNSYLGLTNHPEVKEAVKQATDKYGSGCAGSRFLNGTLDIHLELEGELADLVGKPAAVLYSTGFQTNLGVISALVGREDYVITDREDHASIVDGCLLCFGELLRFNHNDMESLEARLAETPRKAGKLIAVDGVFSMRGDICELPAITRLAERYGAAILVDDAHGIGVLGATGAGTSEHFGLTDKVQLIMGTFSKSLASLGGFVASDSETIEYLKHRSRALIFSASISPPNAAAALAALRIMRREPERIQRLWHNTRLMTEGLRERGFDTGDCQTPIIPVHVGDMMQCFRMCKRLEEEGLFVNPVVAPAVGPNEALLRISLMATHTEAQIEFALEKVEKVGRELGII